MFILLIDKRMWERLFLMLDVADLDASSLLFSLLHNPSSPLSLLLSLNRICRRLDLLQIQSYPARNLAPIEIGRGPPPNVRCKQRTERNKPGGQYHQYRSVQPVVKYDGTLRSFSFIQRKNGSRFDSVEIGQEDNRSRIPSLD